MTMQIAIVNDSRVLAAPTLHGTCPACGASVIAKCGEIMVWHWAHVATDNCDRWAEGESDWHADWKTAVPAERREVFKRPHIADAVAGDGIVCELQHSPISAEDVRERERFYGEMRWLFDARDKGFTLEDMDRSPYGVRFHRSARWPTIGLCRKRVMLDLGDEGVLSCERINETGSSGWGFLYPDRMIRMWLAGPGYPEGVARSAEER